MPSDEVVIRVLRGNDGARECNAFHNQLMDDSRSMHQWEWEFLESPGLTRAYACATERERIVGTQALIGLTLHHRAGSIACCKSEDTLISVDHRGRGLLERMYEVLLCNGIEQGTAVVWGFTPAVSAFERIGFQCAGTTEQLIVPLDHRAASALVGSGGKVRAVTGRLLGLPMNLLRWYSAWRIARGAAARAGAASSRRTLCTAEGAPDTAGAVCDRFVRSFEGCTLLRDSDYLTWRVFENPYASPVMRCVYDDGQLVGWTVLNVGTDNVGFVVDLMAASVSEDVSETEAIVGELLADGVKHLRKMGACVVRMWSFGEHEFSRVAARSAYRLGFVRVRRGMPVIVRAVGQVSNAVLANPRKWYITRIYTEGRDG